MYKFQKKELRKKVVESNKYVIGNKTDSLGNTTVYLLSTVKNAEYTLGMLSDDGMSVSFDKTNKLIKVLLKRLGVSYG